MVPLCIANCLAPKTARRSRNPTEKMSSRRPSRRHGGGQSLTEFAVILPLLLLILLGIIDFGRGVYAYHVVASSAREGARIGQIPTSTAADIVARVQSTAVGLDPVELMVGISNPTEDTVRVEVSYRFRIITPFIGDVLGMQTLLLRSVSTMYTGY